MKVIFTLLLLSTIVFYSCSPVYQANLTPVTLGMEQGDIALMASAGYGGYDAAAAIAPTEKLVLAGSFNYSPNLSFSRHNRFYWEGMAGIMSPPIEEGFSYRLLLGSGYGESEGFGSGLFDEVNNRNGRYFKVYVDPELTLTYWGVSANFGAKLGYLNFLEINEYFDNDLFRSYRTDAVMIEPHFTLLVKTKYVQPYAQLGLTIPIPELLGSERFAFTFAAVGFGLRFQFSTLNR
jgi:hypothetical protein